MSDVPTLKMSDDSDAIPTLFLSGAWRALDVVKIQQALNTLTLPSRTSSLLLDFTDLRFLDTAGAYYLLKFIHKLDAQNVDYKFKNASDAMISTLEIVKEFEVKPLQKQPKDPFFIKILSALGKKTLNLKKSLFESLGFLGRVSIALAETCVHPSRLRFVSLIDLLHRVGASALPIVGLISFLIGIVLVYQGADQLKRFGAEIFTINLLAVSALRELGILMTAIVVAGRSGSAFTAQIGFMKLNQEIDALQVMGFDPLKVLVVPRMIALLIALPLLTFFSDIMALIGGGVTTYFLLGIGPEDFCHHLLLTVKPWTFWTGMIKAPVFAYFIALTACFEGFRVSGGAESVGQRTTQSVVESIFLVIVMDATFSILFSMLRI